MRTWPRMGGRLLVKVRLQVHGLRFRKMTLPASLMFMVGDLVTQLSTHFSLAEMTRTDTGLDNTPDSATFLNLQILAKGMEEVRALLGNKPIRVFSAYRSPDVNQAVRGVKTSAHCLGFACDFDCPEFGSPFDVAEEIRQSKIKFDQLIYEYRSWVHLSFEPRMRGQVLTKRSSKAPYEYGINL